MDEIEVTIANWEKFNPRKDRVNYTWLRLQNDFFHDQSIFSLNQTEKLLFLFFLCEASKKSKGSVRLKTRYIASLIGCNESAVSDSCKSLNSHGLILIDGIKTQNDGKSPTKSLATDVTNKHTDVGKNGDDPLRPFLEENGIPIRTVRTWGKKWGTPWVCESLFLISAEFNVGEGIEKYQDIPTVVRLRQMLQKKWDNEQKSNPQKIEWKETADEL